MSELQGGKFGHGFASAGVGKLLTPITGVDTGLYTGEKDLGQALISAVVGGTISEVTGGKFVNGAITAAYSNLFNQQGSNLRETADDLIEDFMDRYGLPDTEETRTLLSTSIPTRAVKDLDLFSIEEFTEGQRLFALDVGATALIADHRAPPLTPTSRNLWFNLFKAVGMLGDPDAGVLFNEIQDGFRIGPTGATAGSIRARSLLPDGIAGGFEGL